jgi:hypothetical protein
MAACVILGDSLAAGVAAFRPDCLADTRVGISSRAYLHTHTTRIDADTVLISLGVNDGAADPGTADRLAGLPARHRKAGVLDLPARPEATRTTIRDIAQAFGDRLIETRGFCNGPSRVNPFRASSRRQVSCFCPGSAQRPPPDGVL